MTLLIMTSENKLVTMKVTFNSEHLFESDGEISPPMPVQFPPATGVSLRKYLCPNLLNLYLPKDSKNRSLIHVYKHMNA